MLYPTFIYEEYIRGKIKELRHKTKYWTCPLHVGNTKQFLCLHIRTQLHCSLGLVTHRYRIVTRRAVNLSRGVLCSWNIANTPELKYLLLFLAHVVTVLWQCQKKRKKTATSVCMRLCLAELNCGRRQRDLLVLSIRQSWSVRRESSCINWSHNEFEHPIAFMKDAGRSDSFSGLNGKYGGNFIVPLLTFLTR